MRTIATSRVVPALAWFDLMTRSGDLEIDDDPTRDDHDVRVRADDRAGPGDLEIAATVPRWVRETCRVVFVLVRFSDRLGPGNDLEIAGPTRDEGDVRTGSCSRWHRIVSCWHWRLEIAATVPRGTIATYRGVLALAWFDPFWLGSIC